MIREHGGEWGFIDKLCQMADIPFLPSEWEKLAAMNQQDLFYRYAQIFMSSDYKGIDWSSYYNAYCALRDSGQLENELPGLGDDKRRKLREKWGANYEDEALQYLENLFNGLMTTQNVNGALQVDQALKICKMSYEIDRRIAEGDDFDKLLASYDKLVKSAEFTPKNVKNLNDFDTVGELITWMEKRGWRNGFYDGVTRDIVDETIKNFQAFNQRLYTNESEIGEQITERLHALQNAVEMENYYDTDKAQNIDQYEQDGYNELFHDEDNEFKVNLDEDDET